MGRRMIGALVAAVIALTGVVVVAPTADARPKYHRWGYTYSPDQVLRSGCRFYHYRYRVKPPTNQWAVEFFIQNPNKTYIASQAIDAKSEPKRGTIRYEVCRPSTTYGRHKIRMKVTYQRDGENFDGFVKPSFFRLTRPRG